MSHGLLLLRVWLTSLVHLGLCEQTPPKPQYLASLPAFVYEGRWFHNAGDGSSTTDWPCASVRFAVQVDQRADLLKGPSVQIMWRNLRDRINATVMNGDSGEVLSWALFKGPEFGSRGNGAWSQFPLPLPANRTGRYVVSLRKITTAAPFGMGIASKLLQASKVVFLGLGSLGEGVTLQETLARRRRRMEFVGGSDTAGFCVDGTPDMSPLAWGGNGWAYENCHLGYPGLVGDAFNAEISVEAISGIGLTQNAAAKQKWQLGPLALPGYFNRTLQTDKDLLWDFSTWTPDAFLVSLGGNDYNHQEGNVPSNATFTAAYEAFLDRIFSTYNQQLNVIAVCGMGSPVEKKEDPDNNRCKPCPHVEDAVRAYSTKHANVKLDYIFIPCDGSVATGSGDIGCNGHKNRVGQAEVAKFLIPRIAKIMHWSPEKATTSFTV